MTLPPPPPPPTLPPPLPAADGLHVANATIELADVSKWFGQKVAVSEVSGSVGPGVTGLLGPNGAGKTTLLRLIVGLLDPSEGRLSVLGSNLRMQPRQYRNVGFVAEDSALYDSLTARRFIEVNASLAGLGDPGAAADEALETVGLTAAAGRTLEGFSKGMRQRAKVAAALVAKPEILILDEPLNGADPVQRAHLIDLFVELGAAGKTVLVSSHVLHEVERMADRVIAMIDGRVAAAGSVRSLRALMTDIPRTVRIDCSDPRTLAAALVQQPFVDGVTVEPGTIHAHIADTASLGRTVAETARRLDVVITRIEPEDDSLESVFRYLLAGS